MQIQRIQSIYLLLAAILTGVFLFVPFGSLTMTEVTENAVAEIFVALKPFQFIGLAVPAAVAAIMLFIDIFLYNNFRLQKTVLLISMMMLVVSMGLVIYINCGQATQGTLHWGGGGLLLVAALIGSIAAWVAIHHDERLLRSADRLL